MKTFIALFTALPLIAGCLDENADSPELSEETSELAFGNTRLTFYQNADFTGTTYSIELPPLDSYERIRLIPKPEIETAGLLGRISAVRLRCGTRDARVVLMTNYNQSSTEFGSWSHLGGTGRTINCGAGQTASINLHVGQTIIADRVGSAFLVTHAYDPGHFNFSEYLESAWATALDELPSNATPTKTEKWLSSTRRFHIRQYLTIDHWACTSRGAVFEYAVNLRSDGTFGVGVVDSYVDYGFGDLWSCRDKMKATLDSSIAKAAPKLETGLEELVDVMAGTHARYYLVPDVGLRYFDMFYGDPPTNAPL